MSGFGFGLFHRKPCKKAETGKFAVPIPPHPSINPFMQPGAIVIKPEPRDPIVIKEPQYSGTGALKSKCHFDMSHWRPDPKDPGMHSAMLAKHKLIQDKLPRPMAWPGLESLTKRPN